MENEKHGYYMTGVIKSFGKIIDSKFEATSWAVSEKKAVSNAVYKWKGDHGKIVNSKYEFEGKVYRID